MRIQTQLLLAFLVLAVLPLGGIVGFSYVNSQRAIARAASAEAAELSEEMETRIVAVREGLRSRVRSVAWEEVLQGGGGEVELAEQLTQELGDVAPMIEGLTFFPAAPQPPAAPVPTPAPQPAPQPEPEPRPEIESRFEFRSESG
ncbi:MAG: hypothetical protein AAFY88_32005, partial [Acidobacteriota bacterium]